MVVPFHGTAEASSVTPDSGVDLDVYIGHFGVPVNRRRQPRFPATPEGEAQRAAWQQAIDRARQRAHTGSVFYPVSVSAWQASDIEAVLVRLVAMFPDPDPVLDTLRDPAAQWHVWFKRQGRSRQGRFFAENWLSVSTGASNWHARVRLPAPIPIRAFLEWAETFGAVLDVTFGFGPALRRALRDEQAREDFANFTAERAHWSALIRQAQAELDKLDAQPGGAS